jgi:hypothetical protein
MPKFSGLELLREESGLREPEAPPGGAVVPALPTKPPRQIGKRQNPAYQQISAYVRRDLYEKIRRELIGKTEDFSDLLEEWMEQWLVGPR